MSRYPGANWRGPVPNMAPGGMASHRLYVLHIQEGSEAGTDSWVHNPAAQVSSNFGNPHVGRPDQWVDTDDRAWAQAAYNNVAVSVENEGNTGDSLNANQLENAAQILAWAHLTHGTKLQVTDDPNGEGVIGHGQLGVAGGNHPDCPGTPILNQRQQIVDRAIQIVNGADMTVTLDQDSINAVAQATSSLIRNTALGEQNLDGSQVGEGHTMSLGVMVAQTRARHADLAAKVAAVGAQEHTDLQTVTAEIGQIEPISPAAAQEIAAALAGNQAFIAAVASATAHQVLVGLHNDLPGS